MESIDTEANGLLTRNRLYEELDEDEDFSDQVEERKVSINKRLKAAVASMNAVRDLPGSEDTTTDVKESFQMDKDSLLKHANNVKKAMEQVNNIITARQTEYASMLKMRKRDNDDSVQSTLYREEKNRAENQLRLEIDPLGSVTSKFNGLKKLYDKWIADPSVWDASEVTEEVEEGNILIAVRTALLMLYKDRIPKEVRVNTVPTCPIDCLWSAFSDLEKECQRVNSRND